MKIFGSTGGKYSRSDFPLGCVGFGPGGPGLVGPGGPGGPGLVGPEKEMVKIRMALHFSRIYQVVQVVQGVLQVYQSENIKLGWFINLK